MKKEIVIIGGGPAGIVSAISCRQRYPSKKILLIRKNKKNLIPCGIPYIFKTLNSVEKDLVSDESLKKNNIEIIIDKAINLNTDKKEILLEKSKKINYQKLILALGSGEVKLPIKGIEKKNVFTIKKDFDYLEGLRESILKSKNIVIIGGGFIGVEIADELSKFKKNISIVEMTENLLSLNFDKEFSIEIENQLKNKGVKIYTNSVVEEILGKDKVSAVKIQNKKLKADLVVVSTGARANIDLVKNTKIKIGKHGILVNEFMETNVKDVFAVGDCVEAKHLLTKKISPLMLASTACYQSRIASFNLYKKSIRNKGNLNVFSTHAGDLTIAGVGFSEKLAKQNKLKVVVGEGESPDKHPSTLPNTKKIKLKLIFSKDKRLIGGEVLGGESVGEIVNILSLAIQNNLKVIDLVNLQIASQPLLTPPPTTYPIISAAQKALKKFNWKVF